MVINFQTEPVEGWLVCCSLFGKVHSARPFDSSLNFYSISLDSFLKICSHHMKYVFLFSLIIAVVGASAQDTSSVVIHKDPRIDLLLKKQGEVNAAIRKANARTARGYRLLVINTNKRDDAIAAKTKVYTNFPELKAYLVYQSPYFKLKVGNFKTREEAQQYQKSLGYYFPKGVFVIADTIEVTPEKDLENN